MIYGCHQFINNPFSSSTDHHSYSLSFTSSGLSPTNITWFANIVHHGPSSTHISFVILLKLVKVKLGFEP